MKNLGDEKDPVINSLPNSSVVRFTPQRRLTFVTLLLHFSSIQIWSINPSMMGKP